MNLSYSTFDVFADRRFAGIPLAVVNEADGLSDETMMTIAAEFGYSETVFVQSPTRVSAHARARIFTPSGELALAGHASIGAAAHLVISGFGERSGDSVRVVLEQHAGDVQVSVHLDAGRVVAAMMTAVSPPVAGEPLPISSEDCASMLGLDPSDVAPGARVVTAGAPFLAVGVTSVDALERCRLDVARWRVLCTLPEASDVYVMAPPRSVPERPNPEVRVRMFAPGHGIAEDVATASAAAAMVALLRAGLPDGTYRWTVVQGVEVGRPSRLEVEADVVDGRPTVARVGGPVVRVMDGVVRVDQSVQRLGGVDLRASDSPDRTAWTGGAERVSSR